MGDPITVAGDLSRGPTHSVSIIIPTYNHLDLLKACVASIIAYTDLSNVEVIIVANGCTDGTEKYVASLGPPFRCYSSVRPAGFPLAVNAGISIAKGEYLLFLNNDTVLLPQAKHAWVEMLLAPFKRDPKTGVTGVAKFWWDCAGIKRRAIAFWCAMIPFRIIQYTGWLDEAFSPGTGEDGDFCIKAEMAGYKLVQVPMDGEEEFGKGISNPGFPIYHQGSGTFGDKDYSEIVKRNKKILEDRYGKKAAPAPKDNLESIYSQCKAHPCDVNELFPVLRGYAEKCQHITEFGIRGVMTTWAFMVARPKRLVSYDIEYDGNIEGAKKEAALAGIPFEFKLEDVLKADIEPTDLLFIDTVHTYAQLKAELERHHAKVSKYIAIHDTFTFGELGADNEPGETYAIREFLATHPEWRTREVLTNSNGLTVLERVATPVILGHDPNVTKLAASLGMIPAIEMPKPRVSIIIPTCGKDWEKVLKPCIEAVIQYTDLSDKEVIVVANGAPRAAINWLKTLPAWSSSSGRAGDRPHGQIIERPDRLGYIRAVNAGIEQAAGEFVLTFDDDCFLMPQEKDDWINRLLAPFSDSAMAAAGPFSTVYPDHLGHVLHSGCTMYRKSMLVEIGCFDEAFNPGYMSDEDVAIRLRKAGYKLAAVPEGGPKAYVNGMFVLDFPVVHTGTTNTMPKHTTDLPLVKKNRELLYQRHQPSASGLPGQTGEPGVSVIALNPDLQDLTDCLGPEVFRVRGHTVAAINEAIRASRGTYVLLLGGDWSSAQAKDLLAPFEGSHLTGVSGPSKFTFDCGGVKRTAIAVRCAMIKRSLFDAVGFLDEAFETSINSAMRDFCIRAELAGHALIGVPRDVSWHLKPQSDFTSPSVQRLLIERYGRRGDRLDEIYSIHWNHPSDVNGLFPTLRTYAQECAHVTEFGARDVFSTWAFMAARPKRLVSYDVVRGENVDEAKTESKYAGLDYEFKLEDVLEAVIEPTELLFVDTLHTYAQLKAELERHAGKVSKYILIHDVESFGKVGEDGGPGELQAISEFLQTHPEWRQKEHLTISNGLMVLERAASVTTKISIIIPTYKNNFRTDEQTGEKHNLLKRNLKTLADYTDLVERGIEVIVVCNGCVDGQEEYVESLGAPYRVISFPDAIGYTRATNEGIKVAKGEHLIFINDDVEMLPQPKNQWLDWLLEPFKDPKMGVTGPLQLHDDYADEDVIIGFCLCVKRKVLEELAFYEEI